MKKLLILLLLSTLVFAQPTEWFRSSLVKTELNVSSRIDITATGPNPVVEQLTTDVLFVPDSSDYLGVQRFDTIPPASVTKGRARFEWKNPSPGTLTYGYTSVIETVNNAPRVTAKIPFPIDVPAGFENYVAATQNIDSNNPKIIGQARLLSQGEDDMFVVVNKLAMWVKNNVDYNLSTLTAEVSQPASWVLENRYGVCDELTSLFIAMLRSLNIPAKFISGIAFTNSDQFPLGWGAHGWAEVYFPGVGWVPFDPTFGEFAWVDPGHIKLKESLDPQEPTTVFEWKARDVDVKVHDLDLNADQIETSSEAPFELNMVVSPLRKRVGFGSYNGVVLDVENLADYYIGYEFSMAHVNDLIFLNGESQQITLPPRSKGRVFWKVQVKETLDKSFQYEIPIQIYTIRNDTVTSSFTSGPFDVTYSLADVDSSLDQLSLAKDDFDLACVLEQDTIATNLGKVNCFLQNARDEAVNVNVCYYSCEMHTVPPQTNLPVSFEVEADNPGPNEVEITASYDDLEKKAVLTLVRLDSPKIVIKNIIVPESVNFGDPFPLKFSLIRESVSSPQNTEVLVKGGGAKAELDVGELTLDQEVTINIKSEQLYSSSPYFDIDVSFTDNVGKSFKASDGVFVKVTGVPWYRRLFGWLSNLI